jgi:predicted phage-related endonuclease
MKTWIVDEIQGTPEWKDGRKTRKNASDLACVLGIDPNGRKRSDLVRERATGIEREFSEFMQTRVLNRGHEIEQLVRPLMERKIGKDLYPVVYAGEVDGVIYGASLDGITDDDSVTFECKSSNAELRAAIAAGNIPDGYKPQLEQGLWLSGAELCLFTISDGTEEGTAWLEYKSDPTLRAHIIPAWKQFEEDVKNYQHVEIAEKPAAQPTIELPALFVQAHGGITSSNMTEYGTALQAKLSEVRSIVLVTDQDFSNAKSAATMFREQIKKLAMAKEQMLSQTLTVGEAARMMDVWSEDLRVTALQLEKDVKREDEKKKVAMIDAAKAKYAEHIEALNRRIGGRWMPSTQPDFALAIKGKSKYASMQESIDNMLRDKSWEVALIADTIEVNKNSVGVDDWFLFPDFAAICTKQNDDFAAIYSLRVTKHWESENKRMEAERERIVAEGRAKAEEQARVFAEAERARIRTEEQAKAKAEVETERARIRAEEQAKAKAEVEADALAKTRLEQAEAKARADKVAQPVINMFEHMGVKIVDVTPIKPVTPDEKRAAVIESQDPVSKFMATLTTVDDKKKQSIRPYLVEFYAYLNTHQFNKAA